MKAMSYLMLCVSCLLVGGNNVLAEENGTNATPLVRIGIYDSRAVAYAYFSSTSYQTKLAARIAVATAAKQSGDAKRFEELSSGLNETQAEMHRQVFSTAAATQAFEEIKERISNIQKETEVSALVSKWDETSLKRYGAAEKVDVTDVLIREFIQPDANQTKVIDSIKKTQPMSLEKCNKLIRKGEI